MPDLFQEKLQARGGYRLLRVHLVPLVEGGEQLGPLDILEVEAE